MAQNVVGDVDGARLGAHLEELLGAHDRLEEVDRWTRELLTHDLVLGGRVERAESQGHGEAVDLALRQGERPVLLRGVLRGDNEERVRQRVATPVNGDGGLLHRLQEGRLGAWSKPVELVDEQHMREDRTGHEAERAVVAVPATHPSP